MKLVQPWETLSSTCCCCRGRGNKRELVAVGTLDEKRGEVTTKHGRGEVRKHISLRSFIPTAWDDEQWRDDFCKTGCQRSSGVILLRLCNLNTLLTQIDRRCYRQVTMCNCSVHDLAVWVISTILANTRVWIKERGWSSHAGVDSI